MRPSSMTAAAGRGDGREGGDDGRGGGLRGDQPQGGPVTMPRVPSEPTKSLSRGRPATSLTRLPPRRDQGAVGEHDVEAEHVVGGHAVLHAAQAARVGRDVAADRADLVRAGVGRVPEAVLGRGALDLDVERARLDDGDPARRCRSRRPPSARSRARCRRRPRAPHRTARTRHRGARRGCRAALAQRTVACTCRRSRPARRRGGCRRWRRASSRSGTSRACPGRSRRLRAAASRRSATAVTASMPPHNSTSP